MADFDLAAAIERIAVIERERDELRRSGLFAVEHAADGWGRLGKALSENEQLRAEVERLKAAPCVHDLAKQWAESDVHCQQCGLYLRYDQLDANGCCPCGYQLDLRREDAS